MMSSLSEFQPSKVYDLPRDIQYILREYGVKQVNKCLVCVGKIDTAMYGDIWQHLFEKRIRTKTPTDRFSKYMYPRPILVREFENMAYALSIGKDMYEITWYKTFVIDDETNVIQQKDCITIYDDGDIDISRDNSKPTRIPKKLYFNI